MDRFDLLGPLPAAKSTTVLEASAGTGKTFALAGSLNSTNRTRSMPSCAAHSSRTVCTATSATSSTSQP